jgi:uncharacterized protein involved in exopolysaccharide biosynthesis
VLYQQEDISMDRSSEQVEERPNTDVYDDEIDLRDLILVIWRYWKLIVGIILAFLLIGAVVSFAITPIYQVQAKMSIGNCAVTSENTEAQMTPETAREIMLSRDFQEQAWGAGTNAGGLKITPVSKTNILEITLEASDPEQGELFLNKLIGLFDETRDECCESSLGPINEDIEHIEGELQEINQRIEQTQGLLDNTGISEIQQSELLNTLSRFTEQKNELTAKKSQSEQILNSIESVQVLEKPAASSVPVSPNKKLNIVVAGVLGLMLGVFAAFIADYFRHNPLKLNK